MRLIKTNKSSDELNRWISDKNLEKKRNSKKLFVKNKINYI